jgi:hypothetical protein
MNEATRERGELVAPHDEIFMPHSSGNVIETDGPSESRPQVEREITDEVTERAPEMVEDAFDMDMDLGTISNDNVRGISINPLSSGYMVKVGCQSVAVESTERLIDMLNKYLSDPADFERKWYSKNVRNRLENI